MEPETIIALIAAIGSTVGLIITSLRKRQDTSVDELERKNRRLEAEKDELQADLDAERERHRATRAELATEQDHGVRNRATIATLRRVIADGGLADPTIGAVP